MAVEYSADVGYPDTSGMAKEIADQMELNQDQKSKLANLIGNISS